MLTLFAVGRSTTKRNVSHCKLLMALVKMESCLSGLVQLSNRSDPKENGVGACDYFVTLYCPGATRLACMGGSPMSRRVAEHTRLAAGLTLQIPLSDLSNSLLRILHITLTKPITPVQRKHLSSLRYTSQRVMHQFRETS